MDDSIHFACATRCIEVLATPQKLYTDSYFYFMLFKDLQLILKNGAHFCSFCCVAH